MPKASRRLSATLAALLMASGCGPVAGDAPRVVPGPAPQDCAVSGDLPLGRITSPRPNATVTAARGALIPNGDFAGGLDGWFVSHAGSARLERSERDEGEKLRVLAEPAVDLRFVNSSRFPVTSGAEYRLGIGASVAPGSRGLGAFSLVFLSTRELSRNLVRFDPPAGPTQYKEYTLTGAVPPGASQAMFQVSYDQPIGTVDLSLYDVSYAETGTIDVTGWAIDPKTAADIERVTLYLDGPPGTGVPLGAAISGEPRRDLARACGDARFARAGWHYSWDVRSLGLGEHTVYAVAQAVDGRTTQVSTPIVMAPTFRDDPIGSIDAPIDGGAVPAVATISGWAIDRNGAAGSGVDAVSLYLDGGPSTGTLIGRASVGDARIGVARHYGDGRFADSGWHFSWDTTAVAFGSHTLTSVFHSAATGASTTLTRRVEVGAGREISRGKPARASRFWQQSTPAMAVDGDDATLWNSGGFAPQWIEIDLEATVAIERLRLVTAQAPVVGFTSHRVYGRGPTGAEFVLHEFSGVTEEGQVLEYSPRVPWTGIRFLRVETVESEAWVAWRAIETYLPGSTPTGRVGGVVQSSTIPVAGAQIELRAGDVVVQTVFSDDLGAYLFTGIPAGTYAVRAYGPSAEYARRTETAAHVLDAGASLQLAPLSLPKR